MSTLRVFVTSLHDVTTHRIVDEAVALVVHEDETRAAVIGKDLLDADHVTELVHEVPVLHEEVEQAAGVSGVDQEVVGDVMTRDALILLLFVGKEFVLAFLRHARRVALDLQADAT